MTSMSSKNFFKGKMKSNLKLNFTCVILGTSFNLEYPLHCPKMLTEC